MLGFLLCGNISTGQILGLSGQDEKEAFKLTKWIFACGGGEGMDEFCIEPLHKGMWKML